MNDDVRVAHMVLVHKNPDQANAFIRQLSDGGRCDVYVHVDKKSPEDVFRGIAGGASVHVLDERVDVSWGDISQIDATLLLLRRLLESRKKYDFVCLSSGQDLLVRKGLGDHLARNKGTLFMEAVKIEKSGRENYFWKVRWPRVTRNLYDSAWHPYRILRLGLRVLYELGVNLRPNCNRLPDNYDLYRGSQWFCITGAAAEYIVDFMDKNPVYYETFRNSLTPDMIFFQTLIMNSPYAASCALRSLTYLNWGQAFKDKNHPLVLTMRDIPDIERSGKFFARKFDPAVDSRVIDYFCARTASRLPGA